MPNRVRSKVAVLAATVITLVVGSLGQSWYNDNHKPEPLSKSAVVAAVVKPSLKVYVSGAVAKPGLYDVKPGSRAEDAIATAGGVTEFANLEKVNLAKVCKDGMQINVPKLSSKNKIVKTTTNNLVDNVTDNTQNSNKKINVNTATAEELGDLPGVGAVTAQKIIDYRKQQRFHTTEDLLKIKGIGKAKLQKMLPYLTL